MFPPIRAKCILSTVDNVGHKVNPSKRWSQPLTGPHENARTEPRRGLTKIIGCEHCILASLVVASRNASSCYSTPAPAKALGETTRARNIPRHVGFPPSGSRNVLHGSHRMCPRLAAVGTVFHRIQNENEIGVVVKHEPFIGVRSIGSHPIPQFTLGDCIVRVLEHHALLRREEDREVGHLGSVICVWTVRFYPRICDRKLWSTLEMMTAATPSTAAPV